MGSNCCEHCTGVCCRYLALPLDEPETPRDYDDIRWYLLHEGVSVFIEDGDWYVQLPAVCRKLLPDNRCGTYETRPKICREYKNGECDYVGGSYGYDHLFNCPEDLQAYVRSNRRAKSNGTPKRARASARGKRRSHAHR